MGHRYSKLVLSSALSLGLGLSGLFGLHNFAAAAPEEDGAVVDPIVSAAPVEAQIEEFITKPVNKVRYFADDANVFKTYAVSSEVICKAQADQKVQVVAEGSGWSRLKGAGWVKTSKLTKAVPETVIETPLVCKAPPEPKPVVTPIATPDPIPTLRSVNKIRYTVERANNFKAHNSSSAVICAIRKDQKVMVVKEFAGWSYIKGNGTVNLTPAARGWVKTEKLTKDAPAEPITNPIYCPLPEPPKPTPTVTPTPVLPPTVNPQPSPTPVQPPTGPVPNWNIYRGPNTTSRVLLTFDDCMNEPRRLIQVLDHATARGIGLLIFPTGDCVAKYRAWGYDLPALIRARGHWVGNHSQTHPELTKLGRAQILAQISGAPATNMLRPPYGAYNPLVREVAQQAGKGIVLWTLDSEDWMPGHTQQYTVNYVVRNAKPGDTVLMHLAHPGFTTTALDQIQNGLAGRGLSVCRPAARRPTPVQAPINIC